MSVVLSRFCEQCSLQAVERAAAAWLGRHIGCLSLTACQQRLLPWCSAVCSPLCSACAVNLEQGEPHAVPSTGGVGPGCLPAAAGQGSHLSIILHSHWPAQSQGGVKVSPVSVCDRELSGCWSQGKDLYTPSLLEIIGKGQGKEPAIAKATRA